MIDGFVENGGGFLYCDNHKAFSFNTKELSFDSVLPIDVEPFRPSDTAIESAAVQRQAADDRPSPPIIQS